MGDRSTYELECKPDEQFYEIRDRLKQVSGYANLFTTSEVKWYDHQEHLKTVSLEFPWILITVYRKGEETNDLEKIHAFNGKVTTEEPEITWKSKAEILKELA